MKILYILLFIICCFCGCGKQEVHWSHKACIEEIAKKNNLTEYTYTVEQIEHQEKPKGDDEIYCFDITIRSGDFEKRYYCFSVVDKGEILDVDCDEWIGI